MADTVFRTVLPYLKAVDNGDGTYSMGISIQGSSPLTTGRCATYVIAASDAPAHVKTQADYVCDGVDDDVQIQAAITALGSDPGEIILIGPTFNLTAQVTGTHSISIRGVGSPVLNIDAALTGADLFSFAGSNSATTTLSGNATAKAYTVAVTDATGIVVGGLCLIYDDTVWNATDYPNNKVGELHRVNAISGTTITLEEPLLHAYTTANNATFKYITPITVMLSDFSIVGTSRTLDYRGIHLEYCVDSKFSGVTLKDCGLRSISLDDCYNTDIGGCVVSGSRYAGLGYGIQMWNGTAHTHIHDNELFNCRHCISAGGDESSPGQSRDTLIVNNHIQAPYGNVACDAHGMTYSYYVKDNIMRGDGTAVYFGALLTTIEGNEICWGKLVCRDTNQGCYLTIKNNRILGDTTTNGGILINDSTGIQYDYIRVEDNEFYGALYGICLVSKGIDEVYVINNTVMGTGTGYSGIYVYKASKGIIANNTITNTTKNGIYTNLSSYLIITGNSIKDTGLPTGGWYGILLIESTYCDIYNNDASYSSGIFDYACYESSAGVCDYNIIKNNRFMAGASGVIRQLGTHDVINSNEGYIAPGEIRTYSGTIATLTENAFNSVDNPFGQSVRVLSEDIYVSTGATATTPNIDCGIGSSATTDYTTLFDDLPGETVGFYNSLVTTPGAQTVPQLWASGSGNRYLNHSIKGAAATGMVATYTVTVMGV